MAYDILYYHRIDGDYRRLPDCDKVSDLPIAPAVGADEVACAINPTDASLSRYGYDAAWHERPPIGWED